MELNKYGAEQYIVISTENPTKNPQSEYYPNKIPHYTMLENTFSTCACQVFLHLTSN